MFRPLPRFWAAAGSARVAARISSQARTSVGRELCLTLAIQNGSPTNLFDAGIPGVFGLDLDA